MKQLFSGGGGVTQTSQRGLLTVWSSRCLAGFYLIKLAKTESARAHRAGSSMYRFRQCLGLHTGFMPWKMPRAIKISELLSSFWGWGFRPRQPGEARSPEGTREISLNQGSELSDATHTAMWYPSPPLAIPLPRNVRPVPPHGGVGGIAPHNGSTKTAAVPM